MPHVSVVVCTFNRARSLQRTLHALDAQATSPGLVWDLVVVDNNSTDDTRQEVADFSARALMPVRYVFVGEQGLNHARNGGLAESEGDIVAFTDDDADPAPDWVAMIAAVTAETAADIVGGRILPVWEQPPPPWLAHSSFLYDRLAIIEHPTPAVVASPSDTPMIWGANMAFRRTIFDTVGRFNPQLGAVGHKLYRGEEVELITRALRAGYRAVYDPRLVVWHRIGTDRMRIGYFARLQYHRAAGEALVQARTRHGLAGVLLRRAVSLAYQLLRWLTVAARRRSETLERWLSCCTTAGALVGTGKALLERLARPR